MIAVHVAQLLKLPPGTTRSVEFSDPFRECVLECELIAPLDGTAHLTRTHRGVLVSTQYQTMARLTCSRCLDPAEAAIGGQSDDEFVPRIDILTGLPATDQPEADELAIDDRHLIDLTEVIRQDLLTRIPFQPLCRPDCPGLCPRCGHNLSAAECACDQAAPTESPFAGLADLLRADRPQ